MTDKNVLVITRIFDAPVATVWKYWTDAEHLKKWWGPKDFTAPSVTIDFRVGGKYLSCMRGKPTPDAPEQDFWSTGTYKEIVPMKKIVVTDSFADEKGNVVSSEHYGMKGFPLELEVTFEFEEIDGKTKMTLHHVGIADIDEKMREGMDQGWNQSFDKIDTAVAAK
ncbi:MAG: SRPBCC domain-containing protein [Candidatus Levybacteria bacterium]|nr:SRPBCC domain-containing protein [Candidatus Levybacteria bacterium]